VVPVALGINRSDSLEQSTDYAIRNLLKNVSDPLALAYYLWTLSHHKYTLLNSENLVSWGIGWARHVFIDRLTSRRKDDDIVSGALVVLALINSPQIINIRSGIEREIKAILSSESAKNHIPFKRPAYAAIFLLAAYELNVERESVKALVPKVVAEFSQVLSGGRLFGLFAITLLLQVVEDKKTESNLLAAITTAFQDQGADYEDKAYLLQGLWQCHKGSALDTDLMKQTEKVLSTSPIWQYLMNGLEDIPVGDPDSVVRISHLYRASLLDLLLQYKSKKEEYFEKQFDARFRERAGITWSAFSFYALVLLAVCGGLAYLTLKHGLPSIRYWMLQEYSTITTTAAALYFLLVSGTLYFFLFTFKVLPVLYKTLVKSQIGSDQRIKDIVSQSLLSTLKIWGGGMVTIILMGIVTELIAPAAQHILKALIAKIEAVLN
jgi:hypothetical protein